MFYLLSIITLAFSFLATANVFVEQPLTFGQVVVLDNSTPHTLTVPAYGPVLSSSGLRMIKGGQPGIYTITGLEGPRAISLSVDLPVLSNSAFGSTDRFELTHLDMPDVVYSNEAGEVQLRIGATVQTSGSGTTHYLNETFSFPVVITLSY
ncbi:hypothetical protein EMM73_13265 [Rheinheimera sediminis]|uniref:hypothetical protein n=1 Tax=Rheinheimera sp. YQF-1 TaxID=2499626 RepID=UPI000FD6FEB8|nr:hypothetical protein [Rheinheimera sp. YQF-1]RVT45428.1 hypothetical protein EMM73_13265 [Rheinheimera sp. YQF-1]